MARIEEIISIGSDSETDDIPFRRITRSKTRRCRKQKKSNKNPISIDLTEEVSVTAKKKTLAVEDGINITFEDESDGELEENIRVMWTQNVTDIKRFFLKPSETLESVFIEFSNKYNVPIENIRLRNKDNLISMYDTVKCLNLKVTEILEAYAVDENTNDCRQFSKDKIEVKCLFKTSKKLVFYLHRKQNLKCLLDLCAKEANCDVDRIELRFDGEKVSVDDTPSSLDLEGGECLEVYVR